MRTLPYADPGIADTRSPLRFLTWIARRQAGPLTLGALLSMVWLVAQALIPWAIGRGVDGISSTGGLGTAGTWALAIAGLGVVQAAAGVLSHRAAVANWLYSALRCIQLVARHAARTGPAVPAAMPTGEVVATSSSDAHHVGHLFEILTRLAGAVAAYLVVSAIVLDLSAPLGLAVLIGVPVLVAALTPVIRPLQHRQREQRAALGELTALGADTVAGLRVLRGIGGEQVYLHRYAERSTRVRTAGNRLARTHALLDAAMVLLPGLFLALLTWFGARMVLTGTVSPGALVSLYGFAFFLVIPVRTAGEAAFALARAIVAARRIRTLLDIDRMVGHTTARNSRRSASAQHTLALASEGATSGSHHDPTISDTAVAPLIDTMSGLRIEPGRLTMVVAADPEAGLTLADRLGRLVPETGVIWGTKNLDDLPVSEIRRRIVVSDPEPTLFTGSLRANLDPREQYDAGLRTALAAVSGEDIFESLPDGFDSVIEERGRSLSGGQRQRVALARVLLLDPEILVLVEPTSAVDAHTEASIAERLRTARAGRTTVVVTTSPLALAHADVVAWLAHGRIAASGTHAELLNLDAYRRTVIREQESLT